MVKNMVEEKHYPPSYYRYRTVHKGITITYGLDEYNKVMEYFGGSSEIKRVLLEMSNGKNINPEIQNELALLREKYNQLLKTNKILIDKLKDKLDTD
jgi:hypothetical protein